MIAATDIDRLLAARHNGGAAQAASDWAAVSGVRLPELDALSLVYESTDCDSTEGAIEGLRLGWECGRLRPPDIPMTNRPWSRRAIDPVWCDRHGVGEDAIARVVDVCGAYPDCGTAVRTAFEIGHEASGINPL